MSMNSLPICASALQSLIADMPERSHERNRSDKSRFVPLSRNGRKEKWSATNSGNIFRQNECFLRTSTTARLTSERFVSYHRSY